MWFWFQNSPGAAESGRKSESFIVRERSFGGHWDEFLRQMNMGVSKNRGTPKSSILIGFSIINHPFWGTLFLETPISMNISRTGYQDDIEQTIGNWHKIRWINQLECVYIRNSSIGKGDGFRCVPSQKTKSQRLDFTNPFISWVYSTYLKGLILTFHCYCLHILFEDSFLRVEVTIKTQFVIAYLGWSFHKITSSTTLHQRRTEIGCFYLYLGS